MLNERELSKTELEKREDAMMDLKANKRSFVKRYGKDAEKVMYGRATNIAKKQAENMNKEKLRELIKDKLKGPVKEIDVEVGADRYEGEEKLATAAHALDQLEAKLKAHDWYYMMSDDHRAYQNGSYEQQEIRSIMKDLEGLGYGKDAKDLFNQYAPHQEGGPSFRMKEAKGKDMDKDGDIDSDDYMAAKDAAIKKAKGEIKEWQAPEDLVRSLQKQGVKINLKEPYTYKDIKDALKALGLEGKFDDLMPQNFTITMPEIPKGMFEDNYVKKSKGELKEDWGGSDQYAMNQSIHKDLGEPTEFPGLGKVLDAAESAVDFYWDEWPEYKTDRDGLIMHAAQLYANRMFPEFMAGMRKMFSENLNEDLDLGHQDDEPHMIKAELYRIGKYAMELYAMLEEFDEMGGEVDFPGWWQAKITTAVNNMISAKHYLDFEIKEPAIDAAVDALTGEKPHMGEPKMGPEMEDEMPVREEEANDVDKLAAEIHKALNQAKTPEDKENIKQARKAMNDGNLEAAKKILTPYLEEGFFDRLKANIKGVTTQAGATASNLGAFLKGDKDAIKDPVLAKNMAILKQKSTTLDKELTDVINDINKLFPKEVVAKTSEEFQSVLDNFATMVGKTYDLNKKIASGNIGSSSPSKEEPKPTEKTEEPSTETKAEEPKKTPARDEKGRFTTQSSSSSSKVKPISNEYDITGKNYNFKGKDYPVQVNKKDKKHYFKADDGRILDIAAIEKFKGNKNKKVAEVLAKQLKSK